MRHVRIDPAEGASERPGEMLCVRHRMSRPALTIPAGAPVGEALRLMATHRIHYLPVVEESGALAGIVNLDDLLGSRRGRPALSATVAAVMSAPVACVAPDLPLAEAVALMARHGVGALPVVESARVVGILTQSDVVTALADLGPA